MSLLRWKPRLPGPESIPGSSDFEAVHDGRRLIGWTFAWNGRFSWMDRTGDYMTDDARPDAELGPECGTSSTRRDAERKLRLAQ